MATQAIAGSVDKVLSLGFPGVIREVGMQVLQGNPFWTILNKQKEPWEGESTQAAVVTSNYGKAASYQNDDPVNTTSVQPTTAVQFELGGYQSSVNIPGMEIRKVQTSPRKLMDLQKLETRLAIKDMIDEMSEDLFAATNDSKGLLSLSTVTDASTTIAGLAGGSTWGGTTTASGVFANVGKNDLVTLYSTLSVNATFEESRNTTGFQDEPNLNVTRRQEWQLYWASLESSMRYTPGGKGDVKLELTFMGAPIVVDQHVASGVWYMFRKEALRLRVMSGADFDMTPVATSTAQPDVWARGIIWNGQIAFNSRRPFGKATGLS